MPFGSGFPLGKQPLLQTPHQLRVLAVRRGDDPELLCERESLIHLAIIDHEKVFVGKEDFEGAYAVTDDLAKLRFGLIAKLCHGHMERVVTCASTLGL